MYSEAQKKATAKYNAKAYDRIEIKVQKGDKEKIEAFAKNTGAKSTNEFICNLIKERMGTD